MGMGVGRLGGFRGGHGLTGFGSKPLAMAVLQGVVAGGLGLVGEMVHILTPMTS